MRKILFCLMLTSSMNVFSDLSRNDEALFRAVELMDFESVEEALENGADINATNDYDDCPLICAERKGHTKIVQLLLDHGANTNGILQRAVEHKHIEIIQLLLSYGAEINASDGYGHTALHTAATYGLLEITQFLIANGADVNAKNRRGETPLYKAIKGTYLGGGGSVKLVELLLNHGVDVNAIINDKEETPLLLAVKNREKEIVKLLLKRGANRQAVDIDGNTVFDWARYDWEIARLL